MKLRTQLFSGYSIVLTLMVMIAVISYNGIGALSRTLNWVIHTEKVIGQGHLIEKSLVNMETGQRGFLITGKDSFLEPYNTGNEVYLNTISLLKVHVSDNPRQVQRLENIEKYVSKWLESSNKKINTRRLVIAGAIDADYLQVLLAKGVGKDIFDEMRRLMDFMIVEFRIDGNIKGESLTQAVAKYMVDQETGQRGFLITGKEEFLEPFIVGQKGLKESIVDLQQLVSNAHDRIGTSTSLNGLETLAAKWFKEVGLFEIELRRQVDRGEATEKELQETFLKNNGKNVLDEMRQAMDKLTSMFRKSGNDKAVNLLLELSKALADQESGHRGFIITGQDVFLVPFKNGQRNFETALNSLRKLNSRTYDLPLMKSNISKLKDLAAKWLKKAAEPEIQARRDMNISSTSMKDIQKLIEEGRGKEFMDDLRKLLNEFIQVEEVLLDAREKAATKTSRWNTHVVIGATVFAILLGILAMVYITKNIILQVGGEPSEIADVTESIASGNIDEALSLAEKVSSTGTGIFTSVIDIITLFNNKKDEDEKLDWLKSGQNQLNVKISSELDLLNITEIAISYLAEYTGAQIGAVYINNKDENLELMGTYAFTRRKGLNDKILFGEGLVGEAARTQKMISVTDLPKDYTCISSGIGNTLPKNSLVSPLMYEGRLKGVIELGSVVEFSNIELEFIETVSTIIATAVTGAQTRVQVNQSLQVSQDLSQELQAQQEELKVANEELTEQADALKISEDRLKVQSEELKASNEELEEKTIDLNLQRMAVEVKNKDIQEASEELKEKARDLEIASQYKSEFLANMSHELRTPLNSLLILSESLADNDEGNLTVDQLEAVNVINSGGKDLLELINDILDLSKVEAGKLDINIGKVELNHITTTMKRQFQHVADKKGLELIVEQDPTLTHINGDKKRVEQILKNLLSNAFKFTSSGSVTLKVSVPKKGTEFQQGQLSCSNAIGFTVIDTGIGIEATKQKSIFEAFQQADGSTSRKYGGTGLGLTISRELSRLMQGELQIVSELSVGSEFTLYLPCEGKGITSGIEKVSFDEDTLLEAPELSESTEVKKTLNESEKGTIVGKKVLIVEDDEAFSNTLKKIVEKKGYYALTSATGMEGLTLAKLHSPDAILLDLGLPDIDGIKVLEQLKFDLKTRHIPVHVISGRNVSEDLLTRGAIACLNKPVGKKEVNNILSQIEDFSELGSKTVLVVDDDENTIFSVRKLISRENLEIISAATAAEAEDKILNHSLDCIILDLSLPDMTGFELLEKMKKDKVSLPPVIIYTGRELSRTEFNTLNEMAKSIVIKGAESSARLLDDVSLFLHSVEKSMPEEQKKIITMLHDSSEILKDKKILLVDDDSRNLFAVGKLLQKHGMQVTTAENGKVALNKVKNMDFDVVLMDIMMPVMDGYEATRAIRKLKGNSLPIIAFTAKAMSEDRDKCIDAGANDYITKPLDTQKLISLLNVWLFQ